jgi:hypothetical protein
MLRIKIVRLLIQISPNNLAEMAYTVKGTYDANFIYLQKLCYKCTHNLGKIWEKHNISRKYYSSKTDYIIILCVFLSVIIKWVTLFSYAMHICWL